MYYCAKSITQHLTQIQSPSGENLYLIVGQTQAVLIDAGLGVGHLRTFVKSLTDKPLTVLLSHGHIDHASGASEFENVYLNSVQAPRLQRLSCRRDQEVRQGPSGNHRWP